MESAPLTWAHSLAQSAESEAPKSLHLSQSQHQEAAAKYKEASEGIEDSEALRILALLEAHHSRLANILNHRLNQPEGTPTTDNIPEKKPETINPERMPSTKSSRSQRQISPSIQRRPPRDLSASIASNLASARGIPTDQKRISKRDHPSLPKHHTWDGHGARRLSPAPEIVGPPERKHEGDSQQGNFGDGQRAGITPSSADDTLSKPQTTDDAFHNFYNRFEGLLSKLSAPLAFAGLPLIPDDEDHARSQITTSLKASVANPSAASEHRADINKVFSKAALRAVKEDHGPFPGVQESFYVVPTGGGTVSYAGMIARHATQIDEDNDQVFVDAQEKPTTQSPQLQRTAQGSQSAKGKTTEELEMENDTLKKLTDELSKRLYMWEKNAQNTTSALQQSMAFGQKQPESPTKNESSDDAGAEKIRELQEQAKVDRQVVERLTKEKEKLNRVVKKYRERWEELKAGARERKSQGSGRDSPAP